MEKCCDACEEVSEVIESVIMKNSEPAWIAKGNRIMVAKLRIDDFEVEVRWKKVKHLYLSVQPPAGHVG